MLNLSIFDKFLHNIVLFSSLHFLFFIQILLLKQYLLFFIYY